MYLVSQGINQAQQILLISDRADWIWQHIPALLNRLGCGKFTNYLLDFYHEERTFTRFCALRVLMMKKKEALGLNRPVLI